jgi:hypothetical protein
LSGGFFWKKEDGMRFFQTYEEHFESQNFKFIPYGISSDGRAVVGSCVGACRWTRHDGFKNLGPGTAWDVSDDGSVIVGSYPYYEQSSPYSRAFIWTEKKGYYDLKEYLEMLDLNLDGWTLGSANAISNDGKVITGSGRNPDGNIEGWIANISSDSRPQPGDPDDGVSDGPGDPAPPQDEDPATPDEPQSGEPDNGAGDGPGETPAPPQEGDPSVPAPQPGDPGDGITDEGPGETPLPPDEGEAPAGPAPPQPDPGDGVADRPGDAPAPPQPDESVSRSSGSGGGCTLGHEATMGVEWIILMMGVLFIRVAIRTKMHKLL